MACRPVRKVDMREVAFAYQLNIDEVLCVIDVLRELNTSNGEGCGELAVVG